MKTPYHITVARLENERAAAPYSRSGIPRHGLKPGWNLEDTPSGLRVEAPGCANDLPAASLARLRRLQTLAQGHKAQVTAPCSPAVTFEDEKKIPFSFNPPRYRVPKKGPNAGKQVEVKWMLRLVTRTVTFEGGPRISATARIAGETVKPPGSAGGRGFSNVYLDFKSRWGAAKAAELVEFLKFADCTAEVPPAE